MQDPGPPGGEDGPHQPTRVPLRRIPTQARSREKVARALDAADRIARQDGVAALSLSRVAAESGVSVGAIHQYLPDRDAITAALVVRYHERIEQLIDDVIDQVQRRVVDDPVSEVVGEIAGIYQEEASVRLLRGARGSSAVDRTSADHKRRMVGKVHELLVAAGVDGSTPTVARVVFGAADAVMHEAFGEGGEPDGPLLAELEAMLRAYLAPPTS